MKPTTLIIMAITLIYGCSKEEEVLTNGAPWFELIEKDQKLERTYKNKPLNLPVSKSDLLVFSTEFSDKTVSVNLYNHYIFDWQCHPYLVTRNAIGKQVDTLFPFTRNPYYGLDSHYNPYLEITKNAEVIVTDSGYSYIYTSQPMTLENGEKVLALIGDKTNYVSTRIYEIREDGTFGEMQFRYQEY